MITTRLAYIQNLLDQAQEFLVASSDVRWASSAADAFAEQLNVMIGTADSLQAALDDTQARFAALEMSAADATQMHLNLSAQIGYQPVPQGWHG